MAEIILPPKNVIEFFTGKRSEKEQIFFDKLIDQEKKVKVKVLKRGK